MVSSTPVPRSSAIVHGPQTKFAAVVTARVNASIIRLPFRSGPRASYSCAERRTMPERKSTWEGLPTEARHPASAELDRLPTERVVELLVEEDRRGLDCVRAAAAEIARVAEHVAAV